MTSASAHAGVVTLDNGVTGDGHVAVPVDELGTFGWLIAPPQKDVYDPPGSEAASYATYAAGIYVFATTSDGKRTSAALTSYKFWHSYLEPGNPQADGLAGDRTVARVITSSNASSGPAEVQSEFVLEESSPGPFRLTFALRQTLAFDAATSSSRLEQAYLVTNSGTVDMALVFYVHADAALPFGTNDWNDDIVGVGAGSCFVYAREAQSSTHSIALIDGGSTVPVTAYYAGKCGVTPSGGAPAFESTQDSSLIWDSGGIPPSWRDELATIGVNVAGESPASPPPPGNVPAACATAIGDASLGHEYRFTLAAGASETIRVHRHWGTITLACPPVVGGSCGDGTVNGTEVCDDRGDSEMCNANCTVVACGDSYVNTVMEVCDEGGDTATCNADCMAAVCGDSYINAAAGEECEADPALCDPATCTFMFSVGGGCAGCAANDAGSGLWPLVLMLFARRRRRHP